MEDISEIIQDISKHTSEERQERVLNRTIGRSHIKLKKNGRDMVIWVTNRESKGNIYHTFTQDYRLIGEKKPYTDTLTSGYTVTSKNTTWGRILLENFCGNNTCITPAGKEIEFTQYNSSHYNQDPYGGRVTGLMIGTERSQKYLNLGDLQEAARKYVGIIEKQKQIEAKRREAEEAIKRQKQQEEEARRAAQKAKDEEERRRRLAEEEKARQERLRKEKEIKALEEENIKNEKEAKEYEDSYQFIRTQATLRYNPVLDRDQNNVKFSHVYDDVVTIIDGGPGTGKSTTLIQRLKFLIDAADLTDYMLNHPDSKLTSSKIQMVTADNSWVFFSPTELLCKYLKKDMGYEGLTQYEDKALVWNDFLRKTLIRDDYKIAGTGRRFTYTDKYGKNGLFKNGSMSIVEEFVSFYIQNVKERLLKVASVDYKKYSWKTAGKMIADKCLTAKGANDLVSILRIVFELSDMKDRILPNGVQNPRQIISGFDKRVEDLKNQYVVEWRKDEEFYNSLLDCEEDILDSGEGESSNLNPEELEELEEDDKSIDVNTDIELQKNIKRIIRRMASFINDETVDFDDKYAPLYELLKNRINTGDLKDIADIALFNREVYPCVSNPEVFLLNNDMLSELYMAFRKKLLEEENQNCDLQVLEKICGMSTKHYLLHDECCLLIGFINNLLIRINRMSNIRYDSMKGLFKNAYEKHKKCVIGVDEATDYSALDYYAIYSLRNQQISSVTLSGDMMQSLNENGISNWKMLKNASIFPAIDIMPLKVSYRQGPKLIKLAQFLFNKVTGKRAPYKCYLQSEKKTPDPLWFESSDMEEKSEWMVKRILDVQKAYGKVPSIAIFVNDEKEANELEELLKDNEELEDAGIDIKNCTKNDELEAQDSVRIFLLNKVKGMEFEVVFFFDIDKVPDNKLIDRYLYVGLSRATFYMAVTSGSLKNEDLIELSDKFNKKANWKVRKR